MQIHNNKQQAAPPNHQANSGREETSKNPFKDTSAPEETETPEDEAEAEQQRKEALTERD